MAEFTIERLGHHGDGIAEGPLYAPLTLPGEVVSGAVEGDRLADIRIVMPSETRVRPPCRHFKSCGGCQLQHASDDFVAEWKTEVVTRALAAQGLKADMRPILTSPPQSRRRATLSARRTKKGAMAGFHARASDVIVEVAECQLLHPDLLAALPVAEALARVGASRRGELSVTATLSEGGLDVAVEGGLEPDGPLLIGLAQEAERHDLARLSWNGEVMATRRAPVQRFGIAEVTPPPGAFLQATESGEQTLLAAVRQAVGEAGRIVDLFAGCGTFSLPLAETSEVHAVEGSAEMTKALDHGWRHVSGLRKVTVEARDLFRRPLMPDELQKFDAAVIDPPRAGAEAQIEQLCTSGVEKIAYVSCNPVTFARDANRLDAAGYALHWVQVVDQFRWSSHIELVAGFTLTSA
ncbi:class I SAM-dependent RNA methyltransferase [Alisedimentitalea sp. MJ-SS2]|uniref:class I SAM-dependent RNA methyltransferase n=1 Tax=Aliisedimentitalea sp. MJ-SS2 TaxID=3049795 RepID=UPI002908E076|nr:class I SAM-dependent RNA methyltransferase [Alisedimentitalea sp. MJ-SS2]MDU8927893.1 class I SAM-dependent RNA methyltransferase [Alisedimentitalea sp. MJ-SS2]